MLGVGLDVRESLSHQLHKLGRTVLMNVVLITRWIDIRIGRGDQQHARGSQHPPQLRERPLSIFDMLDGLEAHNQIEGIVVKWQFPEIRLYSCVRPSQPSASRLNSFGTYVYADNARRTGLLEDLGAIARAARRIENVPSLGELTGPPVTPAVLRIYQLAFSLLVIGLKPLQMYAIAAGPARYLPPHEAHHATRMCAFGKLTWGSA